MDLPPPPNPGQMPPSDASNSFNSIFGSKPITPNSSNIDTIAQVNSLGRRVRMMEEAVTNIRRKIEIQEEDQLKADKRQSNDIQTLFGEIDEMKRIIKSFKDDMIKIIKELQGTAKKDEIVALQKYVEIWQPIHFVTQKEVQSIVDHAIDMRLSDKSLVESLFDKHVESRSIESAPVRPEHIIEREPDVFVETIREKVRDARIVDDDAESEIPARQRPIEKPKEKVNTDAYPQSILHALASNIERERKTISESHIHPSDPQTDIIDVEKKQERKIQDSEIEKYRARIDAINKRKKELHDLLGGK